MTTNPQPTERITQATLQKLQTFMAELQAGEHYVEYSLWHVPADPNQELTEPQQRVTSKPFHVFPKSYIRADVEAYVQRMYGQNCPTTIMLTTNEQDDLKATVVIKARRIYATQYELQG